MRKDRRYFHADVGYNYRMTNVQAALGCAQLERAGEILERKAQVLAWYREALAGAGVVALNPHAAGADPICWLVIAVLPEASARMQAELNAARIDTRPFFVPLSELPPYSGCRLLTDGRHIAADIAGRGLCLPSSTKLTPALVQRVAAVFQQALTEA